SLSVTGELQNIYAYFEGPSAGIDLRVDTAVVLPLTGFRQAGRNTSVWVGGILSDTALRNDKPFARVAQNEYHIAGAENALKFAGTEPGSNSYSFSASDAIVNSAMTNG